jgi:hypothetical protein
MSTKKSGRGSKVVVRRDAGTGEFVTKQYVETHKKSTVTEHYPKHPKTGNPMPK